MTLECKQCVLERAKVDALQAVAESDGARIGELVRDRAALRELLAEVDVAVDTYELGTDLHGRIQTALDRVATAAPVPAQEPTPWACELCGRILTPGTVAAVGNFCGVGGCSVKDASAAPGDIRAEIAAWLRDTSTYILWSEYQDGGGAQRYDDWLADRIASWPAASPVPEPGPLTPAKLAMNSLRGHAIALGLTWMDQALDAIEAVPEPGPVELPLERAPDVSALRALVQRWQSCPTDYASVCAVELRALLDSKETT